MKKLCFLILLVSSLALPTNGQNCTSLVSQNQIRGLVKVGGYIWAATNGGLVKYDTATYEKTYFTKDNSDLPVNALNKIATDASGNIWINTEEAAVVIKYDGNTFTTFDFHELFSAYETDYPTTITIDGTQVYATYGKKLFYYNGTSWSELSITYAGEKNIMFIGSVEVYQNELYVGLTVYGGGNFIHLVKYDGSGFTLVKEFEDAFGDNIPQSDQFTATFTIDDLGNFWFVMNEGGIAKVDHATLLITFFNIPSIVRNCPEIYITVSILLEDKLYFGSLGKGGLYFFDITNSTWNSIADGNSTLPRSDIFSMVLVSAHTLYIGNEVELVRVSIPDKQCTIHNINQNHNRFDFFDSYTFDVIDDNVYLSGQNYFGSNDSIRVYNPTTADWFTWKTYGGNNKRVYKFVRDNSGKLWICTYSGLYYLESSTNTWIHYTVASADTLYYVTNLVFDKNNNMWLLSNQNLVKIDPVGVIKKIYHTNSGVQDLCYDGDNFVYTAAAGDLEGFSKVNIVTDAVTYYQTDNYGYDLQYPNMYYANDTLYYRDANVLGKIHNGQLVRKFELRPYVSQLTIKAPTKFVNSFCVDQNGKVWLLDRQMNKLFVYDPTNGFQSYNYSNSCISENMSKIACDESNNIWVKGDGLYKIENTNTTTGIDDPSAVASDATVYPNPVSNLAHIVLPSSSAAVRSVSVLDMRSAERIAINNYFISTDEIQLNLSFLKQGVYILRITTEDDKVRNLKFVKMQ